MVRGKFPVDQTFSIPMVCSFGAEQSWSYGPGAFGQYLRLFDDCGIHPTDIAEINPSIWIEYKAE